MQNIVIDKPYEFVPPDYGTFWPRLLGRFVLPPYLRASHGVDSYELLGVSRMPCPASTDAFKRATPSSSNEWTPWLERRYGGSTNRPNTHGQKVP